MQQEAFVMPTNPKSLKKIIHNTMNTTQYRFILQKQINFGDALYIVGNIQQLGQWNINCALRLDCYLNNFWIIDVDIPIDTQIQYKYFISSYQHYFNQQGLKIPHNNWIGNQHGNNIKLFIGKRDALNIQETRKTKQLKIMSFNIRCETKDDQDQFHWNKRRQNCVEVIKQHYPSIIGVQQPRRTQPHYLQSNLHHLYNYVGVSRDQTKDGQQVGVFYDKQRFIVVQYGFKWISESKKPGSIGFGARMPRYYTYLILQDIYNSQKYQKILDKKPQQVASWIPRNLIMVTNVHLDHQSGEARQKGVSMIAQQVQQKKQFYQDQLKDVFVFGDFNTHETPHVFHRFSQICPCLESMRSYFDHKNLRELCDFQNTFNGFRKDQKDINNPLKVIDHIFVHNEFYKPCKFMVIRDMIHKPKNPKYSIVSDHFPIMGIFKPVTQLSCI